MKFVIWGLCLVALVTTTCFADGPKDNLPDNVRRIPKLGVKVPDKDRAELELGLRKLKTKIDNIRKSQKSELKQLLPDVLIFYRAVDVALKYDEFFSKGDINKAKALLKAGTERADQLSNGQAPWTIQTGLVIRGFISRLDQTVQPIGLVVPESYTTKGKDRYRLDLWFHGRGETLSEVNFIHSRMRQVGQYAPNDTFVLHPYGRYSNAFKFAGEVDVLEGLDAVKSSYRIDDDRISVRGFSMGGAACWQFAVHYADRWFAANPGAGFSETPEFLKFFQKETLNPTVHEKKLWHMYDCTDYAINLFHCPTVAYSGELDIQKQAADIMESALAKEGIDLVHVIGPKTKHSIHKDSKIEIERRLKLLAARGRERVPREIHFATYTLKYNRMHWVTVDAMEEHWRTARVDAVLNNDDRILMKTSNVTDLTFSMPSGWCPFAMNRAVRIKIDDQPLDLPRPMSDRSWQCRLHKNGLRWRIGKRKESALRKRHNLQGPIDDAFMDSFVIVRPTKTSAHGTVDKWTRSELEHAVVHWRRHFRGDAIVKNDVDVADADIANSNLILFGDPSSNSVLKHIYSKLPVKWMDDRIKVGEKTYDSKHHAVILAYPNPLNPKRYVVLNSGFTFREYDYLNNARQVPKLPDWAIVDLRTPVNSRYPGKIVAADFFDEAWQLKK